MNYLGTAVECSLLGISCAWDAMQSKLDVHDLTLTWVYRPFENTEHINEDPDTSHVAVTSSKARAQLLERTQYATKCHSHGRSSCIISAAYNTGKTLKDRTQQKIALHTVLR